MERNSGRGGILNRLQRCVLAGGAIALLDHAYNKFALEESWTLPFFLGTLLAVICLNGVKPNSRRWPGYRRRNARRALKAVSADFNDHDSFFVVAHDVRLRVSSASVAELEKFEELDDAAKPAMLWLVYRSARWLAGTKARTMSGCALPAVATKALDLLTAIGEIDETTRTAESHSLSVRVHTMRR